MAAGGDALGEFHVVADQFLLFRSDVLPIGFVPVDKKPILQVGSGLLACTGQSNGLSILDGATRFFFRCRAGTPARPVEASMPFERTDRGVSAPRVLLTSFAPTFCKVSAKCLLLRR